MTNGELVTAWRETSSSRKHTKARELWATETKADYQDLRAYRAWLSANQLLDLKLGTPSDPNAPKND